MSEPQEDPISIRIISGSRLKPFSLPQQTIGHRPPQPLDDALSLLVTERTEAKQKESVQERIQETGSRHHRQRLKTELPSEDARRNACKGGKGGDCGQDPPRQARAPLEMSQSPKSE